MRNPDEVLNSLASKSLKPNYKYKRIYRNLYNPQFFLMAYSKIYAKEGNMTEGTDNQTIDGISLERINNLIESLKDLSYKPKPARRVYIPKTNEDKRPLGIPSVDDKLVQEVIRSILENIFERNFSEKSHGFRPNKSCHTALCQVEKDFKGTRWFVEGDIKSFFDNIQHGILINLLRKRIEDEKFIQLIWKFLKAGYLENWKFHKTYSGMPQGGIISPILSNIYLHELDRYVENLTELFNKGKGRSVNPKYKQLEGKATRMRKKLKANWDSMSEKERNTNRKEIESIKREMLKIDYSNHMDDNFKRLRYVRYADDFLIGIIGSKEDAENVKVKLARHLQEIGLELSQEKTLITNTRKRARFLGYDIDVARDQSVKRDKNGVTKRNYNYKVRLHVPNDKWVNNLLSKKALKINGNTWKPAHRANLKDYDDLEILSTYNAEIKGIYEYYKLAMNVSVLGKYKYIMEYSMYKTLASKYKTTVKKICRKYRINGKFGIKYKIKKGWKIRYLYDEGFKRSDKVDSIIKADELPIMQKYASWRTSLIDRLEANECEWCKEINVPLQIHHIRKLKDLKGKKLWEKVMIARKRKTMVLCERCHVDLHQGRLN